MQAAMIFLGIIIGCSAGFLLAWFFARNGPPPEPFFLRFLRVENRSARLDTRLMTYELSRKVNDLIETVGRLDQELQAVRDQLAARNESAPSAPIPGDTFMSPLHNEETNTPPRDTLVTRERNREISQLLRGGLSPDEVSEKLQVARGEVELLQSLVKNRP